MVSDSQLKLIFVFIVSQFFLLTQESYAQVSEPFPKMMGEDLKNKSIELPKDVKGKYTLIGLAYSKKASKDLQTWSEPVYFEFIDQSSLTAMVYDVNVYLVMLFTGAKKAVYQKAKTQIKDQTATKLWSHTFLLKADLNEYTTSLNLPDKDTPAIYVLDSEGVVVYFTTGAYSKSKFKQIADLMEN